MSLALGAGLVPLAVLVGVGTGAAAATGEPREVVAAGGLLLALAGLVAASLLVGGAGLLARAPWGWWATAVVYGAVLLHGLRRLAVLAHVDWEHPRALEVAGSLALRAGAPALGALAMLVLLALPRVRQAYGLRQAPRERRRRRVAGGGPGPDART